VFVTFIGTIALGLPTLSVEKFMLPGAIDMPVVPPVPLSITACGLPCALSVTLIVAVVAPAAFGMKSTKSVQLAPATSFGLDNAQAFAPFATYPKLVAEFPVIAKLEMFKSSLPLFVNVTVCVALVIPTGCDPKSSDVGAIAKIGAAPVPTPVIETTCCVPLFPPELSTKITSAFSVPVVVGAKKKGTTQLAPGANTELPAVAHVSEASAGGNWAAFGPESDSVNDSGWFPVFVNVTC